MRWVFLGHFLPLLKQATYFKAAWQLAELADAQSIILCGPPAWPESTLPTPCLHQFWFVEWPLSNFLLLWARLWVLYHYILQIIPFIQLPNWITHTHVLRRYNKQHLSSLFSSKKTQQKWNEFLKNKISSRYTIITHCRWLLRCLPRTSSSGVKK